MLLVVLSLSLKSSATRTDSDIFITGLPLLSHLPEAGAAQIFRCHRHVELAALPVPRAEIGRARLNGCPSAFACSISSCSDSWRPFFQARSAIGECTTAGQLLLTAFGSPR